MIQFTAKFNGDDRSIVDVRIDGHVPHADPYDVGLLVGALRRASICFERRVFDGLVEGGFSDELLNQFKRGVARGVDIASMTWFEPGAMKILPVHEGEGGS